MPSSNDFHTDAPSARSLPTRVGAPEHLEYPGGHLGLTWAPVSTRDVDDILELFDSCGADEISGSRTTRATIEKWIERSVGQTESNESILGRDQDGTLQAVGAVDLNRGSVTEIQAELIALVRPQWRRKGVGRALLDWQDGRARQLIVTMNQDLPVTIRTIVKSDNLDRRRLLAAGGFSQAERLFNLRKPLRQDDHEFGVEAESKLRAAGLDIIEYDESVRSSVYTLHNRLSMTAPFRQPVDEGLWEVQNAGIDASHSIVLVQNGEIVGYALAQTSGLNNWAYIARFGVERVFRSTSTERDMIVALLGRLYEQNLTDVEVRVQQDQPARTYLEEEGFLEGDSSILYTIDL